MNDNEVANQEITFIPIEHLRLDPENPRLPSSLGRSEPEMLQYLADTTSIIELMSAISENGYFPGEPVVAIPNPDDPQSYLVVEGNRRLTAVKILNDHSVLNKSTSRIRELSEKTGNIQELPVVVKESRSAVLPYLGYRHITGVKQWEPLAKARYILQLYQAAEADSFLEKYKEVAQSIGSRSDYIKRNLDALAVYNLIESENFYGIEGLNELSLKFSILSTALADSKIAEFVGLRTQDGEDILNPIDNPNLLNIDSIKELTEWLFEKKEGATRVGDSRNLRKLSAIIGNKPALEAFRHGSELEIAYRLTSAVAEDFAQLLTEAENLLIKALSLTSTIEYSDAMYDLARQISKHIKTIGGILKDKKPGEEDDF
ncbi:ParB N-terminal domain-containing protein [Neisseria zoodegmatis]|uniref:Chromosome partitioning protein ParB n=1 Tax=Neisseria zoodegmatis TaxID=326523 RepID=A0AB38DQJ6_9NEIS|nr:ParB N-terminal domain-containing protein [Neisseria zoodegmatis]OSI09446.1 chromosome partitioning protein ParB [Neisseria zoodegmatis]SNU79272.1 ParB/RepB/Spo0J family partition protein [Neisseria zoodegmatis]